MAGIITAMVAFVYLSITNLPQDTTKETLAKAPAESPFASAKQGLTDIFHSAKENAAGALESARSAIESLKLKEWEWYDRLSLYEYSAEE